MKNIAVLICLICGMSFSTNAQLNLGSFKPGYLVKVDGDTLRGYMKQGSFVMKLKPAAKGKAQRIDYREVRAYAYEEDNIQFHNLSDGFYELVVEGPVNLYEKTVQVTSSDGQYTTYHTMVHYAVTENIDEPITKLRITSTLGKGKVYFRNTASEYFKDCEEIVRDIESGAYNRVNTIADLVERYNEWVLSNSRP